MSNEQGALLQGEGLTAGYGAGPDIFAGVHVAVRSRRTLCIVGPNGAGKSTLLALLAGVLRPRTGRVVVRGVAIDRLGDMERAQIIGYLPQHVQPFATYAVRELVALGRFPHGRGLGFETRVDAAAVDKAMALTRVEHLSDRPFEEISGGERQRVLIASVLASEPRVLLLDEPTAALDMGQRSSVFGTLKELAARGAAVVVVTHDLNLAGLFADDILLLARGGVAAAGRPADVITREHLEQAYGGGFILVERPGSPVPGVLPAESEVRR